MTAKPKKGADDTPPPLPVRRAPSKVKPGAARPSLQAKAQAEADAAAAAKAASRPGAKARPPAKAAAKPAPKPAPVPDASARIDAKAAVSTVGLTKTYGDLVALAPLDLTVHDGEALALVGHNGSGKTTLLRMLAGLLEPSEGAAGVFGEPVGSLSARAHVSYLSDNPTFYDDLSVWEHLEYTARLHGRDDWEQDAADLLGILGIYERADDLPSRFSRGLRQKAQIAVGLIRPLRVLLVDEPFVGLDAAGKEALLALLDDLHGQGVTLLVATHELSFVERVGRCLALRNGELLHDGHATAADVIDLVGPG